MDKINKIIEILDTRPKRDRINYDEFLKMCTKEELIEIGQTKTLEETEQKIIQILKKWDKKEKEAEEFLKLKGN